MTLGATDKTTTVDQFLAADESPRACPVCAQPYMVFFTRKKTVRTNRELPVYACLACRSFSNPSGYREDREQLARDLEWHKSVFERNAAATRTLLAILREMGVDVSRILDIGAGTGTLLRVASEFGCGGVGYEVNPLTQPYARDVNMVDVRAELWSKNTDCGPFTLLTCIMVMEHIAEPRPLIGEMVDACTEQQASLFISVPFLDRNRWHFLHDPDPRSSGSPFFDQDVHVTHFSSEALEALLREFGMRSIDWIRKGLWHGVLARP